MPPCRIPQRKYIHLLDIPVLPFLAPSLFTPWPKSLSRGRIHAYTTVTEVAFVNNGCNSHQVATRSVYWQQPLSDGTRLSREKPQLRPAGPDGSPIGKANEIIHTTAVGPAHDFSCNTSRRRPRLRRSSLADSVDVQTGPDSVLYLIPRGVLAQNRKFVPATLLQLPLGGKSGSFVEEVTRKQYRRYRVPSQTVTKLNPSPSGSSASDYPHRPFRRIRRPYRSTRRLKSFQGDASICTTLETGNYGFKNIRRQQQRLDIEDHGEMEMCPREWEASPMEALRFKHNDLHANSLYSFWSTQFLLLSEENCDEVSRQKKRLPARFHLRLSLADETIRALAKSLSLLSTQEISLKWKELTLIQRRNGWPQIMLHALHESPSSALKFLAASSSKPYPPAYAIRDSIDYIVSWYLSNVKEADTKDITTLFQTVTGALSHFEHGYFNLTQKTIFLLLKHLTISQAEKFYTSLIQSSQRVYRNTLLHFVDVFARAKWTNKAVEVLRRFHECGGDFSNPRVESVCATLLRRQHRCSSGISLSDSELFVLMLDLGLQPNIVSYNILLQNSVSSGDAETAWQIHDMMLANSISPDSHTYSILLNDAKIRMDRSAIDRILELVESKNLMNEYVLTDLLHAIFLLHYEDRRKNKPEPPNLQPPFKRMLPLFAEYFDIEPIRDLLPPQYKNFTLDSERGKMRPPKESLVIMFVALVREFTDPRSTYEWYKSFSTMVLDRNPYIVPLVESSRIYDAVIMSFGQWSTSLHLCTKVIHDMLARFSVAQEAQSQNHNLYQGQMNQDIVLAPEASNFTVDVSPAHLDAAHESLIPFSEGPDIEAHTGGRKRDSTFRHCKPSAWTWTVLLKSFTDNSQPRAAEKALAMMKSQEITPNIVTWNCLVSGYVAMQDIANTVGVIKRLEQEGLTMNHVTIKLLSRVLDREALIEALDQKDERRNEVRKRIEDQTEDPVDGHFDDLLEDEIEGQIEARMAPTLQGSMNEGIARFVDKAEFLKPPEKISNPNGPRADKPNASDLEESDIVFVNDEPVTKRSSPIRLVGSTSSFPDKSTSKTPFRRFHRY